MLKAVIYYPGKEHETLLKVHYKQAVYYNGLAKDLKAIREANNTVTLTFIDPAGKVRQYNVKEVI